MLAIVLSCTGAGGSLSGDSERDADVAT